MKYAGLKLVCNKCKNNTHDHFSNHLTLHMQCKHCQYELKSVGDDMFWERVCSLCGKEFKSVSSKKEHVARHVVPEQKCGRCVKVCTTAFNLKRHLKEEHGSPKESDSSDEYPFRCDICGTGFSHLRNMKSHKLSIHTDLYQYRCKVCNKEFKRAFNLKVHLKTQHKVVDTTIAVDSKMPPSELEHECKTCSKVFNSKGNLSRHIQGVHEKKVYTCTFCDNSYSQKVKLISHQAKFHNK